MADGSAAMAAGDRGALDMGLLADGSIDQDRMRRGALYGLLCPNGAGASGAAADPHSLQALEQAWLAAVPPGGVARVGGR